MTLNILLCDPFTGLLPKDIPSYVSMFTNLFDSVRSNVTYHIYDVYKNQFPLHLRPDETYLITGSNSSIFEEKGWIKGLLSFIRGAYAQQIPLAGVCFGHQAIAYALGGKIAPFKKGWEAGIRESRIVDPTARRYFTSNQLALHYSHHGQVTQLPRGAVRFATSDSCKNEGFLLNNHILTFQGHPEYTDSFMRYLIRNHSANEPEEIKEKALESIQFYETMGQKAAQWILDLPKSINPKSAINQRHTFFF